MPEPDGEESARPRDFNREMALLRRRHDAEIARLERSRAEYDPEPNAYDDAVPRATAKPFGSGFFPTARGGRVRSPKYWHGMAGHLEAGLVLGIVAGLALQVADLSYLQNFVTKNGTMAALGEVISNIVTLAFFGAMIGVIVYFYKLYRPHR
jgi:hypothetical protein